MNINVPLLGTTGAVTKADGGVAVFGTTQLYTGTTNVNGGTLQIGRRANQTLYAQPTTGNAPGNEQRTLGTANTISMIVNLRRHAGPQRRYADGGQPYQSTKG